MLNVLKGSVDIGEKVLATGAINVTDRIDDGRLTVHGTVKGGGSIVIADMESQLPPVKLSWNSA